MNPNVKEVTEEDPKVVCQFCHSSKINALEWGPIYQLDGITAHYFCILFSAGMNQNGEDDEDGICCFMPEDILKELSRGAKLKCKFCRKKNATIGCWNGACKTSYHFRCGLAKGSAFHFIDNFESYCSKHKVKLKSPSVPGAGTICAICFCTLADGNDDKNNPPLWPPCCNKDVFFHKRCIMEMGRNHGLHYFKCPFCNNKDEFSRAMRMAGVYLPDMDAAWETEPNAFAEHNQRYSRCDAEDCLCPDGKDHYNRRENTPWSIVRCGGCGASAIHKECGGLQNLTWRCATCARILLGKGSSRIQRSQNYDQPCSPSKKGDQEDGIVQKNPIKLEPPDDVDYSYLSDECSEVPSCSYSSSDYGVGGVERVFDKRYGRDFVVDQDDSSSGSSDEEGGGRKLDDETVFIPTASSSAHKQIIGGVPEEISAPSPLTCQKDPDTNTVQAAASSVTPPPSPPLASIPPSEIEKVIEIDEEYSNEVSLVMLEESELPASPSPSSGFLPKLSSQNKLAAVPEKDEEIIVTSNPTFFHPSYESESGESTTTKKLSKNESIDEDKAAPEADSELEIGSSLSPSKTDDVPTNEIRKETPLPVVNLGEEPSDATVKSAEQPASSSAHLDENFNSQNENLSEDDEDGICIINCFSLAPPPKSEENSVAAANIKTEETKTVHGPLPDDADIDSEVDIENCSSSDEDGTEVKKAQHSSVNNNEDVDSDIELIDVIPKQPASCKKSAAILAQLPNHRKGKNSSQLPVQNLDQFSHQPSQNPSSTLSSRRIRRAEALPEKQKHSPLKSKKTMTIDMSTPKLALDVIDLDSDSDDDDKEAVMHTDMETTPASHIGLDYLEGPDAKRKYTGLEHQ